MRDKLGCHGFLLLNEMVDVQSMLCVINSRGRLVINYEEWLGLDLSPALFAGPWFPAQIGAK